jgi:hypothetical protein
VRLVADRMPRDEAVSEVTEMFKKVHHLGFFHSKPPPFSLLKKLLFPKPEKFCGQGYAGYFCFYICNGIIKAV